MSESKHTPGPWDIGESVQGDLAVCAGPKIVARINGSLYNACCEADARLIAAAPDLLAAIARIATGQIVDEQDNHADTVTIMRAIARAALALLAAEEARPCRGVIT